MAAVPESVSAPLAEPAEALYAKLRPGPGKPVAEVAAHQRARVHSAMVELAGKHGYDAVTVRALTCRAGVSSRAFYQLFGSKEECFLQTYDRVVRRAVKRVVTAQAGERDWRMRLRLAFDAFVRELEREPEAARLALVEGYGVGPNALERVRRTEAMFEAMVAESFSHAPDGIVMPPMLIKGIVAGTARVARARLLEPRNRDLTGLGEGLTEWCLSYYSDAAESLLELGRQAVHREGDLRFSLAPSSNAEESARSSIDDRALILNAVAKLIAVKGSAGLTLSEIQAATGVSRGAFKDHFAGVEECLAAAGELEARRAFAQAKMHAATVHSPASRVHHILTHLCLQLDSYPELTQLCFPGMSVSGPMRIRSHERIMAEMGGLVSGIPWGSSEQVDFNLEASVGAVWGVLDEAVATDSLSRLGSSAPTISFLALAPQIGAQAAADAILDAECCTGSRESRLEPTEIEKNLTAARDGVVPDVAWDDIVART